MAHQIVVEGYIVARRWPWSTPDKPFDFTFYGHKPTEDSETLIVAPHTLTVELPESWNPVAAETAVLEARKAELHKKFAAEVAAINERLANLQAIEYSPATAWSAA